MVSTHRGSHNFFNEIVREVKEKGNPKKISLHTVTLEDALNDGFLYRLQSKLAADDERQDLDESEYYNYIILRAPVRMKSLFFRNICVFLQMMLLRFSPTIRSPPVNTV